MLPPDNHVHTEWSWDAPGGSMERTCARAARLGLPSVAFTDHADLTSWVDPIGDPVRGDELWGGAGPGRTFTPRPLDLDGYLESLQRCRDQFPGLRILSGVELGEPHWHKGESKMLLGTGAFDRVLISLHSALSDDGSIIQVRDAFHGRPAHDVVSQYLVDAVQMIEGSDVGAVLAHIDYPVRAWPSDAGVYVPETFEDEFRAVLRALAGTGRALEVNTRMIFDRRYVQWWREEGGELVTFGSDAHDPLMLARGFAEAAEMVAAVGFRPGRDPHDLWVR